ncbi:MULTISPECIES: heme ABC transporter permease CcmC [Legionella]|uniref:Heme exporter protein C n=1 Tax=Legionella septentrionalis TaxID=2498109 RepID=A0A3S0XFB1_9GAMM|nr:MULTISPECIES: heme ABC transporter permease CcmC [Legionella]MCP0914667.1 heme ABC transporter permease CcmC [Legionella sp. 27cVA30]RUQ81616.1 heme ABC transporter permease [Legionella septentrionalis]RUQ95738.1 heme ABC transporter permease [Legionella septentrionalis]RUR09148.1 heme ABC transporter permease [Legionella septentrionalis]RUR15655.1 heme ABC transporter permease [Legionella septentrionalis]
MWKLLYQLASPKTFYQLSGVWLRWLGIGAFFILIAGLLWGLFFAPADYQQGDAFRIIYIHVPSAFLSMAIYAWMGFLALLLLVWQIKMAGLMLGVAAQLGACMTFLALVTGSIWGKPMWGTWWVWDARLTSELILLFLYGAIIATGHAYQNKEQGDKIMAILTLVGVVDLPIIHYSVYWWNTLHQGATLSLLSKPKIHVSMLYPLLLTLLGLSLYCALMILSKARSELLLREKRQSWVKNLLNEGKL